MFSSLPTNVKREEDPLLMLRGVGPVCASCCPSVPLLVACGRWRGWGEARHTGVGEWLSSSSLWGNPNTSSKLCSGKFHPSVLHPPPLPRGKQASARQGAHCPEGKGVFLLTHKLTNHI